MLDRVGLLVNSAKPECAPAAERAAAFFRARGVECVSGELAEPEAFAGCAILCVFGGDGTILSSMDAALGCDIPILGVNLGRIGFLTEIEPASLEDGIDRLLRGEYRLEERTLLEGAPDGNEAFRALNEVAVTREAGSSRILTIRAEINGADAMRISGDGLIISTVTGSTAYSLSAGGPVIAPTLDAFIMTPICAHTMAARPVVLSAMDQITLVLEERARAVFDGRVTRECERTVTIRRSARTAKFVRIYNRNFYRLLKDKLSEW